MLGAEQESLARQFAGGRRARRVGARTDVPRLAGVLAYLACRPWRAYDGGDHTLFIGEVADFHYRDGDALGFHASGFTAIGDPQLGIEDLLLMGTPRFELQRHYIDGALSRAPTARSSTSSTPRPTRCSPRPPPGGADDVDAAVAAARRAFDEGPWPRLKAAERARGPAADRRR